jgi:hypothetical protein
VSCQPWCLEHASLQVLLVNCVTVFEGLRGSCGETRPAARGRHGCRGSEKQRPNPIYHDSERYGQKLA